MLNHLNWLTPGQQFPPECESQRLNRYAQNKKIFDNRHKEVYSNQWARIRKVLGSNAQLADNLITINFQKKISLKTADFLFQEPPAFSAGAQGGQKNSILSQINKVSDTLELGNEGAIDCSRFGTAVYKIGEHQQKGKLYGKITISSPEFLFTVVDAEDRKKVSCYVLAWQYDGVDERGKEQTYLVAFIHQKGSYTKRLFKMQGQTIGQMLEEQKDIQTGLSDFAVIPVHNTLTSDSVYGCDDYEDVDSLVSEIEVRVSQISKILDIHADPTLSGPESALEEDKRTGEYYFPAGNYISVGDNEESPKYLTWDANLDANFKQIDFLMKCLSILSEMGPALFESAEKSGTAMSGTALKQLYINVLSKVTRIRNSLDKGLKKAIALASEIGYQKALSEEDIAIKWHDGLPNDPKEIADIINTRTGGKATMSREKALKVYDGLSDKDARLEVFRISEEDVSGNKGEGKERGVEG